jgi:hypothetical protein
MRQLSPFSMTTSVESGMLAEASVMEELGRRIPAQRWISKRI